jgi:hypothetical protein
VIEKVVGLCFNLEPAAMTCTVCSRSSQHFYSELSPSLTHFEVQVWKLSVLLRSQPWRNGLKVGGSNSGGGKAQCRY